MLRRTDRRGANALEFALTLPIFLVLVAGIFDWSWFAYQRTILKASVTMGCRAASLVDPGQNDEKLHEVIAEGETVTLEKVDELGGSSMCDGGCDVSVSVSGNPPGRIVQCSVSGTYLPLWGMTVKEQGVGATDLDRLAWQRWPAGS